MQNNPNSLIQLNDASDLRPSDIYDKCNSGGTKPKP